MAKKSIIAREHKRQRTVAKYAELRKKLKEAGDYDALDKLPRNANPIRLHNRCLLTGRPKGYMRSLVSAALSSVRWPCTAKYLESLKPPGKKSELFVPE